MVKQLVNILAIVFFATQAFKTCDGKILMSQNSLGASIPGIETTAPTDAPTGGCRDLTLDACEGGEPPFNTINQGEEQCQQICAEVFPGQCTFYIYDREIGLCQMYDYDKEIYTASCTSFGGPPTTSLDECQNSTDPCSVRKKHIGPISKL